MEVVIIPSDYEQLSEARRRTIIPIYIESKDRYGNPIHPDWFERGVRPIYRELIELAGSALGDRRMVSDIAQPSVHKLWYRHGDNVGEKPYCRVWRRAIWEAKDLAWGGWRYRRGRIVNRSLEQIDREIPTRVLDEQDSVAIYERKILLGSMKKIMREQGAEEMIRVYDLLLAGHNWVEIGAQVGKSADALKHRFQRHARRTFRRNHLKTVVHN
jgi:hypothetical protein